MSNQPLYPQQNSNQPEIPRETNPLANPNENFSQPSPAEYGNQYQQPSTAPQSNPFGSPAEAPQSAYEPSYSDPVTPTTSYGSPSFSQDAYGQEPQFASDPYAASATSANGGTDNNSWNNSGQTYNQTASQQNYPQAAPSSDLNIKALLGLIFSFIFFPVGLVLSWLGLRESKENNDSTGRVLSITGLIVSGIQTVVFVLWIAFVVFLIILGMAGY